MKMAGMAGSFVLSALLAHGVASIDILVYNTYVSTSSYCFRYGASYADASSSGNDNLLSSLPLPYKGSEVTSLPSSYSDGDTVHIVAFEAASEDTDCSAQSLTNQVVTKDATVYRNDVNSFGLGGLGDSLVAFRVLGSTRTEAMIIGNEAIRTLSSGGATGAHCAVTVTPRSGIDTTYGPLATSTSEDIIGWGCDKFPAEASVECAGSDGAPVYGDKVVTMRASAFCEGLATLVVAVGALQSTTWPLEVLALQAGTCLSADNLDDASSSAPLCADDAAVPTLSPSVYVYRYNDANATQDAAILIAVLACCLLPVLVIVAHGLCPGPMRRLEERIPWERFGVFTSNQAGVPNDAHLTAQQRGRRRNAKTVQEQFRAARRREADPTSPEFKEEMARQRAAQEAKRLERETAVKERHHQSKAAKQAQKGHRVATAARNSSTQADSATETQPHNPTTTSRPSITAVAGAYGSHFRNSFEWQQAPNAHVSVHTDTYQASVTVVTTDGYHHGGPSGQHRGTHHHDGAAAAAAAADAAAIAEVREAARAAGVLTSTELMLFEANALSLNGGSSNARAGTGSNQEQSAESASAHQSQSHHPRAPRRQSHRQSHRHSRSPAPCDSRRQSRSSSTGRGGHRDANGGSGSGSGACVICMDAPATYLVLPCGHQCGCQPCLHAVARGPHPQCPICRTPLTGSVRVFAAGYDASGEDEATVPSPNATKPHPSKPAPTPLPPPPPSAPPPRSVPGAGIRAQETSGPVHLNDFFDPPSRPSTAASPPPRRAPERYATTQSAANHPPPSSDGRIRRFGGTSTSRQPSEAELAAEEARRVNRRAISEALARQSTGVSSGDDVEMSTAGGGRSMQI